MVRYCKDGKHPATEYCPETSVVEIAAFDWNREIIKDIKAQDDEYLLQTLKMCIRDRTGTSPWCSRAMPCIPT